jgi:endonuclease G
MAKQKKTNRIQKQVGKAKKRASDCLYCLPSSSCFGSSPDFRPQRATVTSKLFHLHTNLELPLHQKGDPVVSHPGYTLLYDEEHEQPRWVAYHLSREELYGSHDRGMTSGSILPSLPAQQHWTITEAAAMIAAT